MATNLSTNPCLAVRDNGYDALLMPTMPGLASNSDGKTKEGVLSTTLRKRPAAVKDEEGVEEEESSNKFSMASYNSAFLEGIFGDIAANGTANTTGKEGLEDHETTRVLDSPPGHPKTMTSSVATTESMASIKSEHNLAKRRLVSTTKSLQRCGPSLANLRRVGSVVVPVSPLMCKHSSLIAMASTKKTGATTTTKPKDLPATVSASLSFQHARNKTLPILLQQDEAEVQLPASKSGGVASTGTPDGDFGWFVDTDVQDPVGDVTSVDGNNTTTGDPYNAPKSIPLAFSAPTAPATSERNLQAEVEWAQAADTVDEVLGDFF